jgi:hypothetical protein
VDRNIQLYLDSNGQRLEELQERLEALSGDDGAHFITTIKAKARADIEEESASLDQEYESSIASAKKRKQELEAELTHLSSLTDNYANNKKITRATQDLASVKDELNHFKNMYNSKKAKAISKIQQKKEEDINRMLDRHTKENTQAQKDLEWEMKTLQSSWDLFRAVSMR